VIREKWYWQLIVVSQVSPLRGVNKIIAIMIAFLKKVFQKFEFPQITINKGMHCTRNAKNVVTSGAFSRGTALEAKTAARLLKSE
jgi:hypothetical protein